MNTVFCKTNKTIIITIILWFYQKFLRHGHVSVIQSNTLRYVTLLFWGNNSVSEIVHLCEWTAMDMQSIPVFERISCNGCMVKSPEGEMMNEIIIGHASLNQPGIYFGTWFRSGRSWHVPNCMFLFYAALEILKYISEG